jgi:hypothetical protein
MKLALICGPWCSGTTAVAGLLERLGAIGFGPYLQINDPKRPNSYEFIPFRDTLHAFISLRTLSPVPNSEQGLESRLRMLRTRMENQEFGAYDPGSRRPIFLKHPLSALVIPQICGVFETKLIYVLRPLTDIETTRKRRRWPPQYGKPAAETIYGNMFRILVDRTYPTMILRYPELLRSPEKVAKELVQFTELGASTVEIQDAAAFIESSIANPSPVNPQVSTSAVMTVRHPDSIADPPK